MTFAIIFIIIMFIIMKSYHNSNPELYKREELPEAVKKAALETQQKREQDSFYKECQKLREINRKSHEALDVKDVSPEAIIERSIERRIDRLLEMDTPEYKEAKRREREEREERYRRSRVEAEISTAARFVECEKNILLTCKPGTSRYELQSRRVNEAEADLIKALSKR